MRQLPISEYALLSDSHTAALVSRDGLVDWLCFPRLDSPSIFGRFLDDAAGYWTIRPSSEAKVTRQYVEQTLALERQFETGAGKAILTDPLAPGANECGRQLGAHAPHTLLSQVPGITGEVELEIEYASRPEYGIVHSSSLSRAKRYWAAAELLCCSCPHLSCGKLKTAPHVRGLRCARVRCSGLRCIPIQLGRCFRTMEPGGDCTALAGSNSSLVKVVRPAPALSGALEGARAPKRPCVRWWASFLRRIQE